MLLEATRLLAAAGELPVDVRFAIDAEEEVGGHSAVDWVEEDTGPADVALVLDGGYATETLPSFCTALRGICYFHVDREDGRARPPLGHVRRCGAHRHPRSHAGAVGGPARAGRPGARAAARRGSCPPTERGGRRLERRCPTGGRSCRGRCPAGGRAGGGRVPPADDGRALGDRQRPRGRLAAPAEDRAPGRGAGQRLVQARARARRRRRWRPCSSVSCGRPHPRARRSTSSCGRPASRATSTRRAPAVVLALDAFEQVLGTRPVLVRSGGSIPVVAALVARGVPAIVTGFTRPTAQLHSPNENIPASALRDGLETTVEVLRRFGRWKPRPGRARVSVAQLGLTTTRDPRFASPSPRSWPRRCSSAFSATSSSTRSPSPTRRATPRRPSSWISRGSSPTSSGRSGSTTSS